MKHTCTIIMFLCLYFFPLFAQVITFEADQITFSFKEGQEQTWLTGNAIIRHGGTTITATTIILYGQHNETAVCEHNVRIVDRENQAVITGGYAKHQREPKYAKVTREAKLELRNDGIVVTSAVMERYWEEERSIATGDVVITKGELTAVNERAVMDDLDNTITLEGAPRVRIGSDEYFAERIILTTTNSHILLQNNVQAVIYPNNSTSYEDLSE